MCGQWEERELEGSMATFEWCNLTQKTCSCCGELEYCSYQGMLPEGEYEEDR